MRVQRSRSPARCPGGVGALSNAGLWCLGRLQTDADRARVIDGLAGANGSGEEAEELEGVLKRLAPRWFLMRDAHAKEGSVLMQPRWAMSFMRGPMTRVEIRRARGAAAPIVGDAAGGPKSSRRVGARAGG